MGYYTDRHILASTTRGSRWRLLVQRYERLHQGNVRIVCFLLHLRHLTNTHIPPRNSIHAGYVWIPRFVLHLKRCFRTLGSERICKRKLTWRDGFARSGAGPNLLGSRKRGERIYSLSPFQGCAASYLLLHPLWRRTLLSSVPLYSLCFR